MKDDLKCFLHIEPRCFSITSFVNQWFKEHAIPPIDLSTCTWFAKGKYSDVYLTKDNKILKVFRKSMAMTSKFREIRILLHAVQ